MLVYVSVAANCFQLLPFNAMNSSFTSVAVINNKHCLVLLLTLTIHCGPQKLCRFYFYDLPYFGKCKPIFATRAMHKRGLCHGAFCLSVQPPVCVSRVYCMKMAKESLKNFPPSGSPILLVFVHKIFSQNFHRPLYGGIEWRWVSKKLWEGDWVGPQPAQTSRRCTKCKSTSINSQYK